MKLTSLEEMLSTEEAVNVDMDLIDDFPDHPFRVCMDAAMQELIDSIRESGVLVPILLRRCPNGRYQSIAGHRRRFACKQLKYKQIPAIIKDVPEAEAVIWMVDSNIQRYHIYPSEKAKAYQMKMEAMVRRGKRTDLEKTSRPVGGKSNRETVAALGARAGDSGRQVQRYLRLNYLLPALLDKVDDQSIAFQAGVELSYLPLEDQKEICQYVSDKTALVTLESAKKFRKASESGNLENVLNDGMLSEVQKSKMHIPGWLKKYEKYFPAGYTQDEMKNVIENLLKKWCKGELKYE